MLILNKSFPEATKTLSDSTIDLIVTDPPYGVNFGQGSYNDSTDHVLNNINIWFDEMYRLLKPNGILYMFVGTLQIHKFIQAGIDSGFTYKNILAVRTFNNGAKRPKNNFGYQFQPVLFFSKGKARTLNKVDIIPTSTGWYNDKRNKNQNKFTYEYPNWFKTEWFFATAKRATKNFHPNEKNVDFIKFLINTSSDANDIILDPFMGSGSTGVAALETNRSFIGVELNPDYFNIAEMRLNESNNKAT